MLSDSPTMIIPLRMNEDGAITVGETRITLEVVIARYRQGDTPETLHEGFPTVPITDLYAVIAYYLANRHEVDDYLTRRSDESTQRRLELEANMTLEQRAFNERIQVLVEEKRSARGE